jgi:hypothetical protein
MNIITKNKRDNKHKISHNNIDCFNVDQFNKSQKESQRITNDEKRQQLVFDFINEISSLQLKENPESNSMVASPYQTEKEFDYDREYFESKLDQELEARSFDEEYCYE